MLDLNATFGSFPVLSTERLTLRAYTVADIETTFTIMREPAVMRYFGMTPLATREEALQRVAHIIDSFEKRSGIRWAITRKGDPNSTMIGNAGFWRLQPEHARAEIGYVLAEAEWGKGIMREALTAIIDFGFNVMKLHSIEAQIHPDNAASRGILERLGFVQEGYFRENFFDPNEQRFTGTVVFSLLAPPATT